MCNYDQRCCAEAIIKDGKVYIVDDFGGTVKMKFSEFDSIIEQYNKQKEWYYEYKKNTNWYTTKMDVIFNGYK